MMETRRSGKKTALRTSAAGLALLGGWLLGSACTGVEGDVLSVRPVADLAVSADAGPAAADGATPRCTLQTLNTPGCVDLMIWQSKLQAVCSSLGLVLGRITVTTTCPMSTAQGVHFECCPEPVCTPRLQGDTLSCRDIKDLLDSATLDCQARGQQANFFALIEPCALRRYRMAKYMCCSGAPSPATMP